MSFRIIRFLLWRLRAPRESVLRKKKLDSVAPWSLGPELTERCFCHIQVVKVIKETTGIQEGGIEPTFLDIAKNV